MSGAKSLKQYAKEAKARMKSRFWQDYKNNVKTGTVAVENVECSIAYGTYVFYLSGGPTATGDVYVANAVEICSYPHFFNSSVLAFHNFVEFCIDLG